MLSFLLDCAELVLMVVVQTVRGQAIVRVPGGKSIKHDGIKIEFVGVIGAPNCNFQVNRAELRPYATELFYDRGNHYEFLSLSNQLAAPGELRSAETFDFEFRNVEKAYESYHGINVKLRCLVLFASAQCSPILTYTWCFKVPDQDYHGQAAGRHHQGAGDLGAFLQDAPRDQQQHQDGSRH